MPAECWQVVGLEVPSLRGRFDLDLGANSRRPGQHVNEGILHADDKEVAYR